MVSTVFIGFDSMDVRWVRHWAGTGELPNFARVLSWKSAPTKNPDGLFVGGLWPSFWSQAGPAHHGSYCWRQLVPGTYTTAAMTPVDFDAEPFWLTLDQAGARCAIFDVPLVRPIPLRNGVAIVDCGSHDSQLSTSITDANVAERLAELGPYPQKRCDITVEQHGHERLFDDLIAGITMRTAALGSLLDGPFDFLASVYSETHCAGHQMYHLHDPQHPRHDAALAARLGGDPILRVYKHLDAAFGTLLASIPDDAAVMLLFSHGFGPHFDGNPMLREILARVSDKHRPVGRWTRARERLLVPWRGVQRRIARKLHPSRRHPQDVRNLDGTRAWFEIPNNDLYGGVRFNVVGREPWGRVKPGAELDAAITLVTEEMLALRHAESGEPAVSRVLRCDDYFEGPHRDLLPDLFVEWNWSVPFTALTSPTIGVVASNRVALRTGDHRSHSEVFVRHLELPAAERIPVESLAQVLVEDVLRRR